ncbi:MAG: glycerophosphoryl diester phosphodiesterase [Rhodospirillales bacterium]|nr:glycerophosphoryl diester phosphodiesterase [Rhodospirillales bacterium]
MKLPELMGHRGAAAHAPENTLASLRKAKGFGLGWVEFDVQLSADDVPVLMHDDRLHRTTGDRRKIAEVPAEELLALDAGAWFGPEFAGETVPHFSSVLALLGALDLAANIEIKPSPGLARETAEAGLTLAKAEWPAALPLPLISSFEIEALEVAQALWHEAPRAYLMKQLPAEWQETADRLGCLSLHLWHPAITAKTVAAIKKADYQIAAYTVNGAERARALLDLGVDCLITDDPPALAPLFGVS